MASAVLPVSIGANDSVRDGSDATRARATAAPFEAALRQVASTQQPRLVSSVKTPLDTDQAKAALATAWTEVTGEPPSERTLGLLTAQWAHETGHGASMYNYNFAGIKGTGPSGLSVAQRTREGWGDSERRIVDNFRAYRTAEEGATDYVRLLQRRFPEAVDAAKQGDAAGFVRGLKARGYFTGHEGAYLNSVATIASRVTGSDFTLPQAAPPELNYEVAPRGIAAPPPADLRGLYAEMMPGTPESYVDALSLTEQLNRAALRIASASREEDT